MKILAIDTSSSVCSTALLENENIIDENNLDNGRTHSENLMPLIEELLNRNNISLKEINLIAVTVGPGSFTGIRIGISTIKPMSEIYNIPIASVTSLETLARNDESNKNKIVLIDARNNQVYAGVFNKEYDLLEEYMADDINEVVKTIKKYENSIIIGDAGILHKEFLKENIKNVEFSNKNKQSSVSTGKIGYKKYINNDLKNADTVLPTYLRKSQAERMKK